MEERFTKSFQNFFEDLPISCKKFRSVLIVQMVQSIVLISPNPQFTRKIPAHSLLSHSFLEFLMSSSYFPRFSFLPLTSHMCIYPFFDSSLINCVFGGL